MRFNYLLFFIITYSCFSCKTTTETIPPNQVKIVKDKDGKYGLTVAGKPFVVKGAGLSYTDGTNYKALKEAGGTAFRTWHTTHAKQALDSAAHYGLMVAFGLEIDKELHGFDYNDEAKVKEQIAHLKREVDKYKDHPNILCWVVGNELNLLFNEAGGLKLVNPKTYIALNEVVDYIHEVDPNRPVTTTFAGGEKTHIDLALKHCPNLDFISFQVYGGLGDIPKIVAASGIDKPFMVTEFGPMGHWEMPSTKWGREIEEPSASKAKGYYTRMQSGLANDPSGKNIGHFAFLWGQKQERTPTWYGMFHKSGEATATVDELTKFWTGTYPKNRAPQVDSMKLNGQNAVDNIYLNAGREYGATVFASEPDNDPLTYKWTVLKEVDERSQGGAKEVEPKRINLAGLSEGDHLLQFTAPTKKGDYRLFIYVYDGKGKVGNANIPFFVN